MLERIELGNAHGIGDHGACGRATARTHHNAVVLGPLNVVGDHEEVSAELHLADHTTFVVGLLQYVERRVAVVTLLQTFLDFFKEQGGLIPAFGAGEFRHERAVFVVVEHHVAAFGDGEGVVAGVRMVLEQFAHLFGGFDAVAGAVEFESVRIVKTGTGVDAEHGVLCLGIFGVYVVGIVGGQQWCVEFLGYGQQVTGHLSFDGQTVIHEFDEEVVFAEDVLEFASGAQGLIELTETQTGLDDARGAAGGCDHAFGIGGEHLLIHTRITHDATFEVGHGRSFDEVDQAFVVFSPHGQVGDKTTTGDVVAALGFSAPMHAGFVLTCGFRGHIGFDADDGLDAIGHAVGVHLVGAMHVAMVGDADRRHAKFGRTLGQIRNLRRTIEQRIVRVVMQLHKVVPVISHAPHHTVWSGRLFSIPVGTPR